MGRRSISTTKSGKYMNPTDQARKEARKKELKKNKKQRMMVRQAVLKGKDPTKLLEEMENIDKMEYDPSQPPKLSEKVLKDKRKKLKETFDRVLFLYEKEEPEYFLDLRKSQTEYQRRKDKLVEYYEQVKFAERVELDQIPIPDAPALPSAPSHIPLPSDIPLPSHIKPIQGILKKTSSYDAHSTQKRKPPPPPPGQPPELSDSEDEAEPEELIAPAGVEVMETAVLPPAVSHYAEYLETAQLAEKEAEEPPTKQRKIRFTDDTIETSFDPLAVEESLELLQPASKPSITKLQLKMLAMAGQQLPEDEEEAKAVIEASSSKAADADATETGILRTMTREETIAAVKPVVVNPTPPTTAPSSTATITHSSAPPIPPPGAPPMNMMFRPPPPQLRGQPAGQQRMLPPGPPPGRPPNLPPGPPPGLPPNVRAPPSRLPPGPPGMPPPRLMRLPPPGAAPRMPPPGIGLPNPNVLSAPPSIMKPPLKSMDDDKKNLATIEAKPQIKNLIGDVTKFMPTSLRVKREIKDTGKTKAPKPYKKDEEVSQVAPKVMPQVQQKTKDDVYDMFMREMEGLL